MRAQTRFDGADIGREVISGVTIFFAMAYIVLAAPLVLGASGAPKIAAVFGTLFLAGAATLACGLVARTPTAIAPGIGLLALYAGFSTPGSGLAWQSCLLAFALAGVVFAVMSFDWRRMLSSTAHCPAPSLSEPVTGRERILFNLPPAVRASVIASVGAILAVFAFRVALGSDSTFAAGEAALYDDPPSQQTRLIAFSAAVAAIAFCDVFLKPRLQGAEANAAAGGGALPLRLMRLVVDAAPVLSVIALAVLFAPDAPITGAPAAPSDLIVWIDPLARDAAWAAVSRDHPLEIIALALLVLCVLLSDFAGSPFDILRARSYARHAGGAVPPAERERRIIRSLRVDSAANLFAPLLCISPIVYYAESWAGQYNEGRSGLPAIVVGLLLLSGAAALAVSIGVFGQFIDLFAVIPPIAISAILFYVGLLITTNSFTISVDDDVEEASDEHFKPAAFASVVTAVTNDVGLGMLTGLFVYVLGMVVRARRVKRAVWVLLSLLLAGNALSAFI